MIKKTNTFLYKLIQKANTSLRYIWIEYAFSKKISELLSQFIDMFITGVLLYYAIIFHSISHPYWGFLAHTIGWGLTSSLVLYYIDMIVKIMKQK